MTRDNPNLPPGNGLAARSAGGAESVGLLVPLILGVALFMQTLDSHSVTTLLPAIAHSMGVEALDLDVALTAYFAGAAAMLPVSGWCADRLGARSTMQVAIVCYGLGAAACSMALEPWHIIAARTLQGVSGAFLMPVARLILIRTSARGELVRKLTYLTLPTALGPFFGPLLGGTFATYSSWRYMFLLNMAVGAVGLLLVSRHVPNTKEQATPRLDAPGAALLGGFLVCLILLLEFLGTSLRFGFVETALSCGIVACVVTYRWHVRRIKNPLINFSLFRFQTFRAGTLGGLLFRLSVGAEPFLYAMLFQLALGLSAFESGLLTLLASVGMLAVRWTSDQPFRLFGFRRLLMINACLSSASLVLPAFFTVDTPLVVIAVIVGLRGFFRALQLNALNSITYAEPPRVEMGSASSLAAMIQQMGQALSMALAAALIAAMRLPQLDFGIHGALNATFVIFAIVSLASIVFFYALPADAGAKLTGHRPKVQDEI